MSLSFLSFIIPILAWNVPFIAPIFLKKYLALPSLLYSSISLHWSLRKAFLSFLAILWNSAFRWVGLSFSPLPLASLLFSAIYTSPSDSLFSFCISKTTFCTMITTSYTMSWTSIYSSSLCLSDLIPWIYLSFPLYKHKGFDLGHVVHWRKEWQTTSVFLPWEPHEQYEKAKW